MDALQELLHIDPKAQSQTCRKGEIIQHAGDASSSVYFVKQGLLRSYIIDSKGKEHIYMFAPENWIIADLEAAEFNEPVQLFIDCLEDAELIRFDQNFLFNPSLSQEVILENAQLLYRRIGRLQRRVLMLMGAPAIDRYNYFLKIYPDLSNRIPQRMIASYLGIAPQTLSTLRSRSVKAN